MRTTMPVAPVLGTPASFRPLRIRTVKEDQGAGQANSTTNDDLTPGSQASEVRDFLPNSGLIVLAMSG